MNIVIELISICLEIYAIVIIARVMYNWLQNSDLIDSSNHFAATVGTFLRVLTDPILHPMKKILPKFNNFDYSPSVLLFCILLIHGILIGLPLINNIIELIIIILEIYILFIFMNIILNCLRALNIMKDPNKFVKAVEQVSFKVTSPLMKPIKKFAPSIGGIDTSPLILLLSVISIRNLFGGLPIINIIFGIIDSILLLYIGIIVARVIYSRLISFKIINRSNEIAGKVGCVFIKLTNPLLRPIRRLIPKIVGFNFSPLVLLLCVILLKTFIFQLEVNPNLKYWNGSIFSNRNTNHILSVRKTNDQKYNTGIFGRFNCTERRFGSTIFTNCRDGYSSTRRSVGNTEYYNDNQQNNILKRRIGNTNYYRGSDGNFGTSRKIGNTEYYNDSKGNSVRKRRIGNTDYYYNKNGKTTICRNIGNTRYCN